MQDIWFDIAAVGKNTLGDKIKILSLKNNLSAVYTNHSLRATTITMLDNEWFAARHILAISGHKSETSIRSYSRTDDSKRRKIAKSLSDKIIGTGRYNVYVLLLTSLDHFVQHGNTTKFLTIYNLHIILCKYLHLSTCMFCKNTLVLAKTEQLSKQHSKTCIIYW